MINPICALPDHTLPHQQPHAALSPATTVWPRHILVTIDGSFATDPAIRAAHALARRTAASVDVAVIYASRIPMPKLPGRHGLDACEPSDRIDATHLLRTV